MNRVTPALLGLALALVLGLASCGGDNGDPKASSGAAAQGKQILAAGLMRVRAAKSSAIFADSEQSSLHISPAKSGHPHPVTRRNADDR